MKKVTGLNFKPSENKFLIAAPKVSPVTKGGLHKTDSQMKDELMAGFKGAFKVLAIGKNIEEKGYKVGDYLYCDLSPIFTQGLDLKGESYFLVEGNAINGKVEDVEDYEADLLLEEEKLNQVIADLEQKKKIIN